jgi:hypothetical protein
VRNLPVALLALLALAACGRNVHNEAAVRQGVLDHLAGRNFNLAAMDVSVTNVIFRKDQADATVSFSPKGSKGGAGLVMRYALQLQGNRWVVKGASEAGGSPHTGGAGAMGANPHSGGGGALPPGHPAVPPSSSPQ